MPTASHRTLAQALRVGVCLVFTGVARGDTGAFTIVDDPALSAAVAQARAEFLAIAPFDRLDATILVEQPDGSWRRGSFGGQTIDYPASCVKLAYLAAAMRSQADRGLPFDAMDASLRPMITVSSNFHTGVVVDQITGTANIASLTSTADPRWPAWSAARLFTEDYLASRGLLGNQTVLHKTYPTNSGSSPTGAEAVLQSVRGGNRMQPALSASLMLEIVGGAIEADTGLAGSTEYMRSLLTQDRLSDYSSFGFGLPPGARVENKIGIAYDTLEDIAHAILPDGTRIILAAYSNGWDRDQPLPYDAAPLGTFAEMLLDRAGLCAACPPKLVVDSAAASYAGAWITGTAQPDKFGPSYRFASAGGGANTASFDLAVPQPGLYEVWAWWPAASNRAPDAPFTIAHAAGSTTVRVDQTVWGGRWVKLGDFRFAAGAGTVTLSDAVADPADLVVADAIKAVRWPCPVDLTNDGLANLADVQAFVAAFLAQSSTADFTGDGAVSFADVQAFLTAFNAGC